MDTPRSEAGVPTEGGRERSRGSGGTGPPASRDGGNKEWSRGVVGTGTTGPGGTGRCRGRRTGVPVREDVSQPHDRGVSTQGGLHDDLSTHHAPTCRTRDSLERQPSVPSQGGQYRKVDPRDPKDWGKSKLLKVRVQ